ncbi:MAG: class I SAM-dependent methyltransferase [Gemmataceae bacterium]|nr:class I SAM-dependent methyltransferase [Gemmataceae bacterium]
MSPADGVTAAYDRIADAWRADRDTNGFRERVWVDRLVGPLAPGAAVLDVGCGCGEPVAAYLAGRGFRVTGLDGSARMLDHARRAVPAGVFVHGDMRTADPGGPFDAAVAWDSVFHLPPADQTRMFARLAGWLVPGGRLLISLGGTADAGFTSDMHGQTFFYAAHPPAAALGLLVAAGFAVEHWEVDDPDSRGHVAVLAVRRP